MSRPIVNDISPEVLAECQQRVASGETWTSVAAGLGITRRGLRYCMKRSGMSTDLNELRGRPSLARGWDVSKANELLRVKL